MARIAGRLVPVLVRRGRGFRLATPAEARRGGRCTIFRGRLAWPTRNPARWVTLHRGRKVEIDDAGRIVRGITPSARGMPLADLGAYWGERREIEGIDCGPSRKAETYGSKAEAFDELLEANPELDRFLEAQSGRMRHDQALEPVRQRLEKRIDSWRDAVMAVIPGARRGRRPRWDELGRRLWILEEALGSSPAWRGGRIAPPVPAIAAAAEREGEAVCEASKQDAVDDLGARYANRDEAPF
jgi:hypothetical protein